jgi:hypothetical protein
MSATDWRVVTRHRPELAAARSRSRVAKARVFEFALVGAGGELQRLQAVQDQ